MLTAPGTKGPSTTRAMSGLTASMLAVAVTLSLSSCGGDRRDYNPTEASSIRSSAAPKPLGVRTLKDTSFELSWDLQLPKRVRNSWISPELPDIIFFQVVDTYEIYAVDAYSGNTRWVSPPFDKPARVLPGASHIVSVSSEGESRYDDRVWVVSEDTLYSFDAVFGQLVWRYNLPFSPSTSPLALGTETSQRVFIGDWDGRLQVVSYNNEKNFPYVLWQMNMMQSLTAGPIHKDGLIYLGDHGGKMHCFKLDREQVWSFDSGAPIYGPALARSRRLYVGNENNTLYALNRLSGERLGAQYMQGPIRRAPFAFDGEPNRVYIWVGEGGGRPGGLYAIKTVPDTIPFADESKKMPPLEVERMDVEWFVSGFDRLVGSTPEHLFVTSGTSTKIFALHRATGKVMWSWDTSEMHQNYRDAEGRRDPRETVFIAQYQDSRDLNRSIYTADVTGHVIAVRVFGDKPGDPLTGARVVKTDPKPAEAAEKPAEAPADN